MLTYGTMIDVIGLLDQCYSKDGLNYIELIQVSHLM